MIRFIVTLLTALALFCSQASAGFLLNSFAVKSPLVFVGASKAEGGAILSTTLTGGISSTIKVGDLLVAIVGNAHTTTIAPAIWGTYTWNTIGSTGRANGTNDLNYGYFYAIANASPPASFTTSSSAGGTYGYGSILVVFRNQNGTQFDATTTFDSGTTSGTSDPPSITSVTDGATILALGMNANDGTSGREITAGPSGYTSLMIANNAKSSMGWSGGAAMLTEQVAGVYNPPNFIGSPWTTSTWSAATIAIRP